VSTPTPVARELLTRLDALHPIDRDSVLAALEEKLLDEMEADNLWRELVDRYEACDCDLPMLFVQWMKDDGDDQNREYVLTELAKVDAEPELEDEAPC
jgi:hypothetical protein